MRSGSKRRNRLGVCVCFWPLIIILGVADGREGKNESERASRRAGCLKVGGWRRVEDKGEREAGCRWKKGDGSESSRLGGARKCWLGRRQPKEAASKAEPNRIGLSRNGNTEEQSYLTDLNSAFVRSANQALRAP